MGSLYQRIHGQAPDYRDPCAFGHRPSEHGAYCINCGTVIRPPVQSPFTRRALARELPAKDITR